MSCRWPGCTAEPTCRCGWCDEHTWHKDLDTSTTDTSSVIGNAAENLARAADRQASETIFRSMLEEEYRLREPK